MGKDVRLLRIKKVTFVIDAVITGEALGGSFCVWICDKAPVFSFWNDRWSCEQVNQSDILSALKVLPLKHQCVGCFATGTHVCPKETHVILLLHIHETWHEKSFWRHWALALQIILFELWWALYGTLSFSQLRKGRVPNEINQPINKIFKSFSLRKLIFLWLFLKKGLPSFLHQICKLLPSRYPLLVRLLSLGENIY